MGPQNAILGDNNSFGTNMPETNPPEADITAEKNMAKFSQSKEFEKLKNVIDARIKFWQLYVPGGQGEQVPVTQLPNEERGWRWLAANEVIQELQGLISAYEQANAVVKNSARRTNA